MKGDEICLHSVEWPLNYEEFNHVITELLTDFDSGFIGGKKDLIKRCLSY